MLTFQQLADLLTDLEKEDIDLFALSPYPVPNKEGTQDTCIRKKPLTRVYDKQYCGYFYGPELNIEEDKDEFFNKILKIRLSSYDIEELKSSNDLTGWLKHLLGTYEAIEEVEHPLTGAYIFRIRGLSFKHSTDYEPQEEAYSNERYLPYNHTKERSYNYANERWRSVGLDDDDDGEDDDIEYD